MTVIDGNPEDVAENAKKLEYGFDIFKPQMLAAMKELIK
jgi:hypothetical protein